MFGVSGELKKEDGMQLSPASAESLVSTATLRRLCHVAILIVLLGIFVTQAFAQEATMLGTVTDPGGDAVPNVSITITNLDTGLTRQINSNEVGQYVVPGLRIGHYSLRAQGTGFKVVERKDLVLNV